MAAIRHARTSVARGLDDGRFGPARTLDLRAGVSSVDAARRRVEQWLRDRQMARAGHVLIVSGRGPQASGPAGARREVVEPLLSRLRRMGVVSTVRQPKPGHYVVELAAITALFRVSPRSRHPISRKHPEPIRLTDLQQGTRRELHRLATLSLAQFGVPASREFIEDEMLRHLAILATGIDPDETDREGRLNFMIKASQAAFEDDS